MDDARDRSARRRRLIIRRRTRNRAGHGNAADERHRDVGETLRHELRVRVVAIAAHRSRRQPRTAGFRRPRESPPSSPPGSSGRIRSARKIGMCRSGRPDGMPPNREPIVSTGSVKTATAAVPPDSATIWPGTRFSRRGVTDDDHQRNDGERHRRAVDGPNRCRVGSQSRDELARDFRHGQAEEVFDLRRDDQDSNAVREADDNRTRDELDRRAQARERHHEQDDAGHHRDHVEPGEAVLGDDRRHHHDKRAGRTADLDVASRQTPRRASRRQSPCRCRLAVSCPRRCQTPWRVEAPRGQP